MKRNLLAVALLPGILVFAGCKSDHAGGAYPPVQTNVNSLEDTARFVLLDKGVQESVTSPGIQETRLTDGRLQVVANLRNMLNRRIQVQANCVFKDPQGFVVEDTPFVNVFLDENAQEGIKFVSANDKAQRYTIRVRQAR